MQMYLMYNYQEYQADDTKVTEKSSILMKDIQSIYKLAGRDPQYQMPWKGKTLQVAEAEC